MTHSSEGDFINITGDEAGINMWSRKNTQYLANETITPTGVQFTLRNGCDLAMESLMQKVKGINKIDITPSTHIEGRNGNLYPKVNNTKYLGANI